MQAITVFGIETPDRHGQWRNCQFACRPLPFSVLKLARRFGFYCYHSSLHAGHYRFRYFAQSRNPVSFFRTQGFFRMKRAQARLILRCHAPCIRSHPARGTCRASASMWEAAIPAVSVASRSAARRHGCRTLVDARQPSVGGRLAEWTAKTAVHSPPLSPSADAFTLLPRMSDASPLTGFGLRPQVRRRDKEGTKSRRGTGAPGILLASSSERLRVQAEAECIKPPPRTPDRWLPGSCQ